MEDRQPKAFPIGNLENFHRERHIFDFQFSRGIGRLSIITNNIFRVQFSTEKHWGYKPLLSIEEKEWKSVPIQIKRHAEKLDITTPKLLISLIFRPFNIRIYDHDGHLVSQDNPKHSVVFKGSRIFALKKSTPGVPILGLGDLPGAIDRSGGFHRLEMQKNCEKRLRAHINTELIFPLFCYGGKGKAIGYFLDNPACAEVDLRHSRRGDFIMSTQDGEMDYYWVVGDDLDEVVQGFFTLVGSSVFPPRWSLEIIKGMESRLSAREFLDAYNPVRNNFFMTSSLIVHQPRDSSTGFWDDRAAGMLRSFRRSDRIPHFMIEMPQKLPLKKLPASQLQGLKEKKTLLEEGGGVGLQLDSGGNAYLDPFNESSRDYIFRALRPQFEAGLQGLEIEDGCPPWTRKTMGGAVSRCVQEIVAEDGESMEKLVHEVETRRLIGYMPNGLAGNLYRAYTGAKPDLRPLIVLSSGYAGIQRFCALKPALDAKPTWSDIPKYLSRLLSLNISGAPLLCADLLFENGMDENFMGRLLYATAFVPIVRLRLAPDFNPSAQAGNGKMLQCMHEVFNLRESWLPYLYQLLWDSHRLGRPILYPTAFFFPKWLPSHGVQSQFLVGPHLLVCPNVSREDEFETELPPGQWAHAASGKILRGGQKMRLDCKNDPLPMFFREGAIVPRFDNSVKEMKKSLWLTLFPQDEVVSETDIYDDDGETTRYKAEERSSIHVRVSGTRRGYVVKFFRREGKINPSWSSYLLSFMHSRLDIQKIIYNRRELEYLPTKEELLKRKSGFFMDEAREMLFVKIPFEREGGVIRF